MPTKKTKLIIFLGLMVIFFCSCSGSKEDSPPANETALEPQAESLLGRPLYSAEPSEALLKKFQEYQADYQAAPADVEKLIWFGRFTAYKGDHLEAIQIYTKGMEQFPDEPRLYRHRGHRYITIRKFDQAIQDLEHAARLIKDQPNQIEPDGMPNARNIPVSSLHGNIWYHLGLAYYLKHDMENALRAYQNCRTAMNNNDNLVSSTHWLYMILRRMNRQEEADKYLEAITADMEIIENIDYHRLCLFYKGELSLEDLTNKSESESAGDAIDYAVGNWYFYNEEKEKAESVFEKILQRKSWGSFGYIAAESQYAQEFQQ